MTKTKKSKLGAGILALLKNKLLYINLLLGLAALVVVVWLVFIWLGSYTHNGEQIPVPDVSKLTYAQAEEALAKEGLRIELNDSVFMEGYDPNVVVSQIPAAGHPVKRDRIIYVVVNTGNIPLVAVPQLVNPEKAVALRLAKSILRNAKLNTGNISYLSEGKGDNVFVIAMSYKGKRIMAGDKVPLGSSIDLKVSDNLEDISIMHAMMDPNTPAEISVPDLAGNTLTEARIVIELSKLRIGIIEYGENVQDSAAAIVIEQNPPAYGSAVMPGTKIDLKLE